MQNACTDQLLPVVIFKFRSIPLNQMCRRSLHAIYIIVQLTVIVWSHTPLSMNTCAL